MNVSMSFLSLFAVGIVGALMVAALVLMILAILRRRPKPPQGAPPVPTSLSFLAGFSFFSGLAAMALVVVAAVFFTSLSLGDVLRVDADTRQGLTIAAKIILYVSMLPSVAAIAFALAARGVISESGGTVRGKPLYRTGVLLAILSGAVVLDARVLNPSTWASVLRVDPIHVTEEPQPRGYLGVELQGGSVRVLRVVPGSPAERAGIRAGDWIVQFNGTPSTTGAGLVEQIGSLKPGSRAVMGLRRGVDSLEVTVELAMSFEALHSMLGRQSFDEERLDILKAAGDDHRYSADELTKICAAFDFDDGRLKAIEKALPHLQDPQNAYRILGSLEFSDAKAKVSSWIAMRTKAEKEE